MIPWKTALLLTLVIATAAPAPAQAEEEPTAIPYPLSDGPCNMLYVYTSPPEVDPHPECIGP